MNEEQSSLARAWREALARPGIRAALESIYADCAERTLERKPVCTASGRCCKFREYGHRLYVTGLETAYLVERLHAAAASAAEGSVLPSTGAGVEGPGASGVVRSLPQFAATAATPALTRGTLDAAIEAGGCPFQVGGLCSVHAIRPLGCRVYFCDPTAQEWQQELYERLLRDLRALHERFEIPYRYGEWREMLGMFVRCDTE